LPPSADVAQLRLLSLAVDDALARDDLDEAFALLDRRQECLAALDRAGVTLEGEELRELVALNDRLASRLRAGQGRLADAGRVQAQTARAVRAYAGR
jgi:hypothetical protein